MSINPRCPKCGSHRVQLTNERSKHGCLWFLVFGFLYLIWIPIKWCIGLVIFILWDWWMAIIKALLIRGYVWKSKGWFTLTKKTYYCHDCGFNFRASHNTLVLTQNRAIFGHFPGFSRLIYQEAILIIKLERRN